MWMKFKMFFAPIRRCKEIEPNLFVCVVKTAGFSKETLQTVITHNHLFMIDGDYKVEFHPFYTQRFRVHEAIQLPPRVELNSIQWDTRNGITILTCQNRPKHTTSSSLTSEITREITSEITSEKSG